MTTPVLDVLRKARELISVPERWTQGPLAADADGVDALPEDEAACKWCAAGAVYKAAEARYWPSTNANMPLATACRDELELTACELDERCTVGAGDATYNETHTHPEVLALFDRTIARMEAQG